MVLEKELKLIMHSEQTPGMRKAGQAIHQWS
jgi:hypothetical protein